MPHAISTTTIPAAGSLAVPPTEENPGPPEGLTLDQAIDHLIKNNLDLRSKFYEIPQAKADILTASLRANPVFYADAQLVPYGQYTRSRPGGQAGRRAPPAGPRRTGRRSGPPGGSESGPPGHR